MSKALLQKTRTRPAAAGFTAESPALFDLAISTVDRPKQYLHKLINRLGKDRRMRLIVGSPSYDYLRRYRKHSNIEIVGVDLAEWRRFEKSAVQYRASWNYWRCFKYGVLRMAQRKGLLILEDDVIPSVGWEKRLDETVDQIESDYGQEYVLALYTYHSKLPRIVVADRFFTRYPAYTFGGTQAMYYPEGVRVAFSDYLASEGVDVYRMPYDWLLSEYLRRTGIPLFVTTPCLFEHIGDVTTGLSWGYHRAGHFAKKVPRA